MLESLKRSWKEFQEQEPGRRFQERYRRRHESGESGPSRFLFLGVGLVIMAAGAVLMPAPGPGTIVLLFGAALVGQEVRPVARAMDWIEVHVRGLFRPFSGVWNRAPGPVKVLIVVLELAIGIGFGYWVSRLLGGS
jgi:hypothetical protein